MPTANPISQQRACLSCAGNMAVRRLDEEVGRDALLSDLGHQTRGGRLMSGLCSMLALGGSMCTYNGVYFLFNTSLQATLRTRDCHYVPHVASCYTVLHRFFLSGSA